MTVRCHCGLTFCFSCKQDDHVPALCDHMRDWAKKEKDDSETANWITANTKDCPKCKSPIEKNGGCNHMTCRPAAGGCGHEFCWLCFGDWRGHTSCGRYDESKAQGASAARESLQRYMHYWTRFSAHRESEKLEEKLRAAALRRQEAAVLRLSDATAGGGGGGAKPATGKEAYTAQDWDFVQHATDTLIRCRRVLKHTYVLAFYMKGGPEKNLFEFAQGELEHAVEELSHMLEQSDERIDRVAVTNRYTAAVKMLRRIEERDSEMDLYILGEMAGTSGGGGGGGGGGR